LPAGCAGRPAKTATGRERHIEVKSTALGAQTPFYLSSAELDFARSHPRSFALYRVYDVLDSPRFYVLNGDLEAAVDLIPATYRAQVNDAAAQQQDRGEYLPVITMEPAREPSEPQPA
jgi:hypothetical protein